jgi:hypothetical protein
VKPSELRAWVAEGNTAILLCPYQNAHLEEFGIRLDNGPPPEHSSLPGEVRSTQADGSARLLRFNTSTRFIVEDANVPVMTLFESGINSRPAVLSAAVGSGRIILIADSYPATNLGIAEEDNALFLLQAAEPALRGGEVIFDETATRLSQGDPGVMAYARKSGLQPVFVEAGVLALLALWHFSSRTAPPVSQRARTAPAVPDYVTGRARLYEKAMMGRSAVRALADTLRDALQRTPGLPETEASPGAALLERARRLERLRNPKAHELVELSRSIHDFMNEAIWKPGRRFRRASPTAPSLRK